MIQYNLNKKEIQYSNRKYIIMNAIPPYLTAVIASQYNASWFKPKLQVFR